MADNDTENVEKNNDSVQSRSWAELMREMTTTGLATIFMTEDSVRSYLKEKKLPKELVSLFLETFSKKKDDLYGVLAKEFGRVLSKTDLTGEIAKFLERHHVHFEAKISFESKDTGVKGPETEMKGDS